MSETTTNGDGKAGERTRYRFFKKAEPQEGVVETRDLYELLPGEFGSLKEAHGVGGDGEYVGVPLRSFSPSTLKSETVTKLIVA